MNKQTIYDLKPEGKTIYIRVDYNVPHDKEGHITDDRRIVATLPTLRWLLDHGAALVIASHMGRPKGEVKPDLSLAPVAKRLSELLHMDVKFASDCIGEEAKEKKAALAPGEVLLLETFVFIKKKKRMIRPLQKLWSKAAIWRSMTHSAYRTEAMHPLPVSAN